MSTTKNDGKMFVIKRDGSQAEFDVPLERQMRLYHLKDA